MNARLREVVSWLNSRDSSNGCEMGFWPLKRLCYGAQPLVNSFRSWKSAPRRKAPLVMGLLKEIDYEVELVRLGG
ncbi:MAG: hypothetical protein ACTS4Z_01495 [Candidatus Hodgkinia cicadicola]